jgi:hypothetical protein
MMMTSLPVLMLLLFLVVLVIATRILISSLEEERIESPNSYREVVAILVSAWVLIGLEVGILIYWII